MNAGLKRCVLETHDALRYNPTVRRLLSRYRLLQDRHPHPAPPEAGAHSIELLCAAARLAGDGPLLERIERRIRHRVNQLDAARLDWPRFVPGIDEPFF